MNSFNWCSFYTVGKIFEDSCEESEIRTAIGRFYYAIFGQLRKSLIETDNLNQNDKKILRKKSGKVHKTLIDLFKYNKINIDPNDSEYISKNLRKLRYMRNIADYDSTTRLSTYDNENAKDIVKEINRIIENI